MMGVIMLGIVVSNGVLLVDYRNAPRKREHGIARCCCDMLRPIFLIGHGCFLQWLSGRRRKPMPLAVQWSRPDGIDPDTLPGTTVHTISQRRFPRRAEARCNIQLQR